jgi:nucleoside 2-deoxyribosyltransferase
MRIYVAARFTEKDAVNNLYERLRKAGHEITTDWTVHENVKPYNKHPERASAYSKEDADGVMMADIFLLITSPEAGSGVSAELGVAIASKELTGKPQIYVAGEHMATNSFFYHPTVTRFANLEDALAALITRPN